MLDHYFKLEKSILDKAYKIQINDNFDTVGYYLNELHVPIVEDDYLYLPKFIHQTQFFNKFVKPLIEKFNFKYALPKLKTYKAQFDESLKIKYEPRDYQKDVIEEFINIYNTKGYINGIMQLVTGFGKTYLALYLSNLLKLKTLIIVDESMLCDQWTERIFEYFPEVEHVGLIKGNKLDVLPTDRYVIAYVQTLNSRLRNKDLKFLKKVASLNFGMIIFDECHKMSASQKYSKISSIFDTKNVIGLSATPYKYGLQRLFLESSIGGVIIEKKHYPYTPTLFILEYRSNLFKYVNDKRKLNTLRYLLNVSRDTIKARPVYNNLILNSKEYFETLKFAIQNLLNLNHKIIIIGNTIEQCDTIYNLVIENFPGYNTVVLHSKSKHDFKDTKDADIVVGTYKKCSHGFDKKDTSAIIFAAPYTGRISITQITGRILREAENKSQPVVVFLHDKDFSNIFNVDQLIKTFNKEYPDCKVYIIDEYKSVTQVK